MANPSLADIINNPLGTALMWLYSGTSEDQKQAMAFAFGVDAPVGIGTRALGTEARIGTVDDVIGILPC